jgi:hypothetical protein
LQPSEGGWVLKEKFGALHKLEQENVFQNAGALCSKVIEENGREAWKQFSHFL